MLKFPNDMNIVDFTISFLQFYRDHDRCEQLMIKLKEQKEPIVPDDSPVQDIQE
jgi:hypothetical protein